MFNGKKILLLQLGIIGYVLSFEPCDIHNVECVSKILLWIKNEYESVNINFQPIPDEQTYDVQVSIVVHRLNKKYGEILKELESNRIRLSEQMRFFSWWIRTMTDEKIKNNINTTISGDISVVNNKLSLFTELSSKDQQNTTNAAILNFSNEIFSPTSPLAINRIDQINNFFVELYMYEKKSSPCGNRFSLQEVIYEMYSTLMITEIYRFCITSYSYKIFDKFISKDAKKFNDTFLITEAKERLIYYYNMAMRFMPSLSTSYRHCEPSSSVQVKTMGNLFQLMLYNKMTSTLRNSTDECAEIDAMSAQCQDKDDDCLGKEPCFGRIYKCKYLSSSVTACFGNYDNKRYRWFRNNENNRNYGTSEKCERRSEKRFDFYRPKYNVCYCVCVNSDPMVLYDNLRNIYHQPKIHASVYKISLEPVLSSSHKNWVVTDVTLDAKCSTLYFQVVESPLAKNWQIDIRTDSNIIKGEPCRNFFQNEFSNDSSNVAEKKYVIITEEEYNTINLDDIVLPNNRVITGVKFGVSEKVETPRRIELQVQSMIYDAATGKLNLETVEWTSSLEKNHREIKLDDEELDIPTRVFEPNTILSKSGEFIKFTVSSAKKDAGQSVVPFIEHYLHTSLPKNPLSGVGLYHKRSTKNAGYLAVRLFSRDYIDLIKNNQSIS